MDLRKGICPITNKADILVFSNNPLAIPVGIKYIEDTIDLTDLGNANFFCRTYNLPFNPTYWIKAIQMDSGRNIIQNYFEIFVKLKDKIEYKDAADDVWRRANEEWQRTITHGELLSKIEPVKEDFIQRAQITWGAGFTFEELIKMESQYQSTISSFDVNNPMQLDAVRKASITSVMIDRAMIQGDVKGLKDLSSAYASFMKMAKIDELIESAQTDVLRTVADLANYLEAEGFEFTYYDKVERDIVDKTIENMKDYLRTLVLESTGLDATLDLISKKYMEDMKEGAAENAHNELPLEEIARLAKEELNKEIDEELGNQDILDDDEDFYIEDDYDDDF